MPISPDRKFVPIHERTPAELDVMIDDAITAVGREQFYLLLGGIDAYLERRRRKNEAGDYHSTPIEKDGWTAR